MTPQLLIVKIQSILGGSSSAGEQQKRALAAEYCRMCSDANEHLERVVALIRAGREYPALQVAESSALLDSLNALVFPELAQWRDLCASEDYPVPPPFDEERIGLVQSLYSKGITQTHPLYRDFRRAMRLRDYPAALSVIRTIVKINSYDAEAARECEKLRRKVALGTLPALSAALDSGDSEKILSLCARLDPDADALAGNPVWARAQEMRKLLEERRAAERKSEIISKLSEIDPSRDWEEAITLLSELSIFSNDADLNDSERAVVDRCSAESAKMHAEKLASEKAARARNLISIEIEHPSGGSAASALRRLRALKADALGRMDAELAGKLDARMASLRRAAARNRIAAGVSAAAALALAAGISAWAYSSWEENRRLAEADSLLASIERLEASDARLGAVEKFEAANPDLRDSPRYSARLVKIRESAGAEIAEISRISRALRSVEETDFKTAPSSAFDEASASLSSLAPDIAVLPPAKRTELREKLDALSKRLKDAAESRKIALADRTRELLEEYEAVLADYENFSSELPKLAAREERVLKALRPILGDVSENFKPHKIDTDRFDEIAAKISAARSRYEKFGILRDALLAARNPYDYTAALEMLSSDGTVPADFARKLAPIFSAVRNIKAGQAAEFADLDAIARLGDAFSAEKAALPESKALTSLYKYSTESGTPVYTIAPVSERTQRWNGGYTTVQEASEISFGGGVSSTRYMKSQTRGRDPQGDLLAGGALSPESLVGAEVFKTAASKSLLSALGMAANSNVNPAFKAYLERVIIGKLKADPIATGFAFSPSAREHAEKVLKNTSGMFDYSWIFEKDSKLKFLKSELYSKLLPDFEAEAKTRAKAVEIAESSPMELVGIVLENGKPRLFKDPQGALWGVSKKGFGRIASPGAALPLSPVFSETVPSAKILSEAAGK